MLHVKNNKKNQNEICISLCESNDSLATCRCAFRMNVSKPRMNTSILPPNRWLHINIGFTFDRYSYLFIIVINFSHLSFALVFPKGILNGCLFYNHLSCAVYIFTILSYLLSFKYIVYFSFIHKTFHFHFHFFSGIL